jgi:tetratricopeptide (TPR) repeat protein
MGERANRTAFLGAVILLGLLACVVGLQIVRERVTPLAKGVSSNLLYLQSPELAKRALLSYDSLAADVYWIRAVQHYGRTRLSREPARQYDVLYPLLDLTTSLDPSFNAAYRFGAIFLAEPPPAGPGRTDQAIALLQKGLKARPGRWELAQDIGFVYYWWERDYDKAAEWFTRAAAVPGAPNWMAPLAAVTLTQGGHRETSRRLWQEIVDGSEPDEEWIREQARFRLRQLDAMDQIAALEQVTEAYRQRTGSLPQSWTDLIRGRAIQGIPVDPARYPYQLNPDSGSVTLDPTSSLNPLPMPN